MRLVELTAQIVAANLGTRSHSGDLIAADILTVSAALHKAHQTISCGETGGVASDTNGNKFAALPAKSKAK